MPFGYAPAFLFRNRGRPGNQRQDHHVNKAVRHYNTFAQVTVVLDQASAGQGEEEEQPGQQEANLLQAEFLLEQGRKRTLESRTNPGQRSNEECLQPCWQDQLLRRSVQGLQSFEFGVSQAVNERAVDDEDE